ncbi:MAG: type II secretion system minor pseudopilin GspI [bacterium]
MKNKRPTCHNKSLLVTPLAPKKKQQTGFTLVEVIVALAVVAVALGAIVQTVGNANRNAARLTEETLARWVASNHLTRLRLAKTWADVGTQTGEETMAGQTWYWQQTVTQTPDANLRKIEIQVGLQEAAPSAFMTAYLSKAIPPFNPPAAPRLTTPNTNRNNGGNNNTQGNGQGNGQGGQNNPPPNNGRGDNTQGNGQGGQNNPPLNNGGNGDRQNGQNPSPNNNGNNGQPPPIRVR